jgi:acetoin utilization protein AcuC
VQSLRTTHDSSPNALQPSDAVQRAAGKLAAKPLYIGSEVFRQPAFGVNHPLKIVRHSAVMDLATELGWLGGNNFVASKPATLAQLLEFHDRAYVRALQYADATGRVEREVRERYQVGTLENPLFPGLFERAAMTVGASIQAAELALEGHVVFHPSGGTHHGRPDRACGFCYFNDPVFAINTFLGHGRERVLYVDLDAHHGDGVEEAFFGDLRAPTLSIHEENRWPYSGKSSYPGAAAWNLPVPAGINDSEFQYLLENAVFPFVERIRPDALVLCCGADCLAGDPLSRMELSNTVLWATVMQFVSMGLPTVITGGGGYNPWTVTRYWTGLWGVISGQEIPQALPPGAVEQLRAMECDLVDEDDVEPEWLVTMADRPNSGPVRDAVRLLAATLAG